MRLIIVCLLSYLFYLPSEALAQSYGIEVKMPTLLSTSVYQLNNVNDEPLSAYQISKLAPDAWQRVLEKPINISRGEQWLMLEISNQQLNSVNFYLIFNNALKISDIQIFQPRLDDIMQVSSIERHYNRLSSSELTIGGRKTVKIFVLISHLAANSLEIELLDSRQFVEAFASNYYKSGMAIGGMLTLAFAALALFVANGSKTVLVLFGYFLINSLLLCVLLGLTLYQLFPDYPELRGIEIPILTVASVMFIISFTRQLFRLAIKNPSLDSWLRYSAWLAFAYLPISMLLTVNSNLYVSNSLSLYAFSSLTVIGGLLMHQKRRLATLFMMVFALQLIVQAIIFFSQFGFTVDIEFYILSFGVHGFLIVFILSRQFYYQQIDSRRIQEESLESELATRRAQQELIDLQKETQEQLEARVQERTLELNIALQELEEANRELAEKNTLDELTGLFNRRHYDQKIVAEFRRSRRNLTSLSIVVIDIDHFKSVNDTYGHLAGDNCLVGLARLIKLTLRRSTDIGCRYGGEEFCLILPETDETGAVAIAEELRVAASKQTYTTENQVFSITISCGVSTYQQQQHITPEQLFSAADKALYQAKRGGRNQVKIFDLNTLPAEQELI